MKVWIRKHKMYFDQEAWDLILRHAKKAHQSPRTVVHQAIKRGIKKHAKATA